MEHPHPYTRCLGGRGKIYLTDCLSPLAQRFGNAEFSFCDMESVLSGGCLTARKMFSQMKEAGFIVKLSTGSSKSTRYVLHPDVFRIVDDCRVIATTPEPPLTQYTALQSLSQTQ